MKFCQIKLRILYHTSEGLSDKLFRFGMCLSTFTVVKLLYQPKSSQLVYYLQLLKVLPSSAYHLGRAYNRCAMLPYMPQWSHHTWVRVIRIFSTRVYTWCMPVSCLACRLHLFVARLDRIQHGSGHKQNFFGHSPDQSSWLNLLSIEYSNIWNFDQW